ncbi:DUF1553 domain-containing protein [Roseimaritima ulvae]|uniref:Planctomycete cytochrome C n=1 Tax=Roseimaritima ulvae TaxID=980254 RepID=A0A5B9QJK0_9BACT|nr:DUF1553 domain-containing protein [Roseimaritima ulvae]QEG39297.1 Planctomycete cytochrome C [Roseimaritima ulvae]
MFSKQVGRSATRTNRLDGGSTFFRLVGILLGFYGAAGTSVWAADAAVDFESEIAPLLIRRCVECHQGSHPAGGLLLTTRQGLHAGGDSGPVLDLQHVNDSGLLQRVADGDMPPEKQGRSQQLPDEEIQLLRRWLANGASWPEDRELDYFERTNEMRAGRDWWSLQPVVRPDLPELEHQAPPDNPIDAFVWSKLESEGISPAPPADRRTLIRRVYYDLIGLPPSEAEIEAFLADDSPDAWPRLIDRLLEMPQYGERWARYWLDLARYADTSGYERDQEKPYAWKYRDWVVDAFNHDMPYDQFVRQQIAGDELPDRDQQSVIATGFLRLGTWNDEPNDSADYQYERLEDLVHTTSSTFLALTVKCARCHSHKFDAITQEDYYRMASAFWAGPLLGGKLGGPTAEQLGYDDVLGWTDQGPTVKPLHILKDGERLQPLEEVVPASLSSIPTLERPFDPPPSGAETSHRRLQLADWITDPRNPLTPRVLVNRLWQHHFGQGIVRTPNNFGFLADPPTHPQLLDWLAAEFQSGGQRIKAMHRLILTSQTWQQSSLHPQAETLERRDSTNRLLWRFTRRRLDAEALRDSLLAVSDELNTSVGGEAFKPTISPEALEGLSRKTAAWQASPPQQQNRRSLYMYLKRGLLPPMMTAFDLCDPTLSCGQRDVTIVPTQALAMLNNRFVHDRSERLATVISEHFSSDQQQVRQAWSRVLQRPPSPDEMDAALRFLATQTQTFSEREESAEPPRRDPATQTVAAALVLHLRADQAVDSDAGDSRIRSLPDLSQQGHEATQQDRGSQPQLVAAGIGGKPTLRFDGKRQFMHLAGQILQGQAQTILCVVRDDHGSGHREVISNWNGRAGNAGSSLFLGLTADNTVRFSDAFSAAGKITEPTKPFLLTAINGPEQASVFQNGRLLKSAPTLARRRLDTPWVIGQQGNIDGEYWKGDIAEIRVYNRALSDEERQTVELELAKYYDLPRPTLVKAKPKPKPNPMQEPLSPQRLALASLCHVLMNSNEFLFVD